MASGRGVAVNSASASRVVRPGGGGAGRVLGAAVFGGAFGVVALFLRKKSNTAEPFTGVVG